MAKIAADLTGKQFGILTVISRAGSVVYGYTSKPRWLCQCACGTQKEITAQALREGQRSCGCLPDGPKPNPRKTSVCDCGDHAWLALSKGYVTIIDPQDAPLAEHCCWMAKPYGRGLVYARRARPKPYALHTLIMGGELSIDHANGNPLDNRRRNLRKATREENARNKRKSSATLSRFKGAYLIKSKGLWHSTIRKDGRPVSLGYFKTEEEAARAYDAAATEFHGEFARLNFPPRNTRLKSDGSTPLSVRDQDQ